MLSVVEVRTPEKSKAGFREQLIRLDKPTAKECEEAFPEALKLLGDVPYVAAVHILLCGEPDKDGSTRDMVREIATNTDKVLLATWEYDESGLGYKRVKPPEIPIPVLTTEERIAALKSELAALEEASPAG